MKFRARVSNAPLFARLCGAMGKVDRFCTMHISEKSVRFVLAPGVLDGVELWAGMVTSTLFDDVRVSSLNDNEITLHMQVDHLERALRSGQTAQDVTVKLTTRGGPNIAVLCFVASIQTPQVMVVTQDVPVTVVPHAHWQSYNEPTLPNPEVSIFLPRLRALRSVVDHLKNIADTMTVSATTAGRLTLEVQTASVTVVTSFSNLGIPAMTTTTATTTTTAAAADKQEAHATVEIAKFSKFLHCHQVQPNSVICCMVNGKSLVFHAMLDDLYLTYYCPILAS